MCGRYLGFISVVLVLVAGCGGGSGETPGIPPGNTTSIVSVGRALFFDENLSSSSNQSCASCHDSAAGFADPDVSIIAPVSEGSVGGQFGNRNAPTAAYASFSPDFRLTSTAQTSEDGSIYEGGQFLDGRRSNLIAQAKDPFLNPVEMNNVDESDVVNKVRNASYASDFLSVFGANALDDVATAYNLIATAIAAFETSSEVNKFSSKFDAVLRGLATFTTEEERGFNLFKDPNGAKCANCHVVDNPTGGPALFTDFKYFNVGTPSNPNNPSSVQDLGLGAITAETLEDGKFKVPTLRNIALTAPYMHNGVHETLNEVIQHYDIDVANEFITPEVDRNIASELEAGSFVGLGLSPQDYLDLVTFMETLTDGYIP